MTEKEKRKIRLNVFLTETENKELQFIAAVKKQRAPAALREIAFSKKETYKAFLELQPKIENLVAELGRQGNNLNQMARKLNTLNKTDTPRQEIFDAIETAKNTAKNFDELRKAILFLTIGKKYDSQNTQITPDL